MLKTILRLENWARLAGFVTIFLSVIVCSFLYAISFPATAPSEGASSEHGLIVATWVLAYSTMFLFIAAAIQAGLFIWQLSLIRTSLKDTKIAADAARAAAEAGTLQAKVAERSFTELERPWLFLEGATVSRRELPGQALVPNNWFIKLHWKNVGRAPALIVECTFQIAPKEKIADEPAYDQRSQLSCPRTVPVGGTIETTEVGPAPGKHEYLVFYGKLTYTELSGKRHTTGFAVEVSPHIAAFNPHNNDKYDYYTIARGTHNARIIAICAIIGSPPRSPTSISTSAAVYPPALLFKSLNRRCGF